MRQKEDLPFAKGERLEIVKESAKWCVGRARGQEGWIPKNYISLI